MEDDADTLTVDDVETVTAEPELPVPPRPRPDPADDDDDGLSADERSMLDRSYATILKNQEAFDALGPKFQQAFADLQGHSETVDAAQQERQELAGKMRVPDIKPSPKFEPRSEIEAFGSVGAALGALGSLFTRRPATSAINAMAAAMDGMKKGDIQAFSLAHQEWKDNTHLALKQADLENKIIRSIMEDKTKSLDERMNLTRANFQALQDNAGLLKASSGNTKEVWDYLTKKEEMAQRMKILAAKMDDPTAPIKNLEYRAKLVAKFGEGSETVNRFDNYVRANPWLDVGSAKVQPNPARPGEVSGTIKKDLQPGEEPEVREQQAEGAAVGKARGEIRGAKDKKSSDAVTTLGLLEGVEDLIDQSTGSGVGALRDAGGQIVGWSGPGAQAIAELKVIEGALILNSPRLEGPQSDRDQMLYRAAVGQIADATLPVATRKAAISTVKRIQEKYKNQFKPQDADAGSAPAIAEGTVIVNRETGARQVRRGGQWVPAQ